MADAAINLPGFETVRHPAKFSRVLLPVLARYVYPSDLVLDPFGGSGGVARLNCRAVVHELQLRVLVHARGARRVCGNGLHLPFRSCAFDALVTSPTYGNRMADTYLDDSKRNTYTAGLGRLHPDNTGAMQWGARYRAVHREIYIECARVLKPAARVVLNVSNHIREGREVDVASFHLAAWGALGYELIETHKIKTPRNRLGRNGGARCEVEFVFVLVRNKRGLLAV